MSPSNEQELADIRRTLAMLAERVVRLERKVMGRTLMEVFAEDEDVQEKEEPWCSGFLDGCLCHECRAWREDHE